MNGVYKHDSRVFGPYWDDSRPLSRNDKIKRVNKHEIINMESSTFLHHVDRSSQDSSDTSSVSNHTHNNDIAGKSSSSRSWMYYSTNINSVPSLQLDLQNWNYLELDKNSKQQNLNFWIGELGTIAGMSIITMISNVIDRYTL